MSAEAYDVVVAGGGPAGVAAAVAAAGGGARTLLVEETDRLGGNVAHALVHTICGLYHPAVEAPAAHAHAGFPRRFAEGLARAGGAGAPERAGRVYFLPTEPRVFGSFATETCRTTDQLTLRLASTVTDAVLDGDHAVLTLADGHGATTRARAAIVIDTSGSGVVGTLAGADVMMEAANGLQLPSFIFRMTGIQTDEIVGFARLKISHAVAGATRQGALPPGCESVLVRRANVSGDVWITLNVPRPAGYAPLDRECIDALGRDARAWAAAIAEFLRATRPAFADADVAEWPNRVGIRETRRLRGRVELARAEVLAGRRGPDDVACSTWPIELWDDHRRPHFAHPEAAAGVPLGALLSRSHPRLGMAGRCMSATHDALGALRVIGTAMATGEAIGVAAALAADAGTTLADVSAAAVRHGIEAAAARAERG